MKKSDVLAIQAMLLLLLAHHAGAVLLAKCYGIASVAFFVAAIIHSFRERSER